MSHLTAHWKKQIKRQKEDGKKEQTNIWLTQTFEDTHMLRLVAIGKKEPSSVQFSRSVVSDSLQRHESQHTRPPCPSPTPGVHPDSRPSSQWCHPAISSSVVPFSSCPQFLPASESFPMSQLFAWDGQRIGVSAKQTMFSSSQEVPLSPFPTATHPGYFCLILNFILCIPLYLVTLAQHVFGTH